MINIYCLKDPITNDIRYIGQTINIKSRYRNHLNGNKFRNTHTTNWIQSLLNNNLKPIIEIIDTCNIEDLDKIEQKYIKEYKDKGFNLTNHSIGGHSSLGCKHSLESRLKRSINSKGRKIIYSDESIKSKKLKHSEYLKNNPSQRIDNILSKKDRYKAALKGNKIASEKAKKKVLKLDINNNIIKEYKSVKEAALDNNYKPSRLSHWCTGRYSQKNINFKFVFAISDQI